MIKDHLFFNEFSPWRFDLDSALGATLWDKKGNKLIDFTSGWNVTNLGWNNPEITDAVIQELRKSSYVPGWSDDSSQSRLVAELEKVLPEGLNVFARATGGTEAIEEAIKTARAFTGRSKIISFRESYHGHSLGALALGYSHEGAVGKAVGPLPEGFLQIEFPSLESPKQDSDEVLAAFAGQLESVLMNTDVAAVVTESGMITGWGSTAVAPEGYLKLVRELTKKYNTLLILDEVGTGFSRLGQLWGMQLENVVPDIAVFAKAFSNGVIPIGAMATTEIIAEKSSDRTNIYSTFGWLPAACAAAVKTLEIHQRDKIWEKAKKDGDYFQQILKKEMAQPGQKYNVRGIGMEIGLSIQPEATVEGEWADKIVDKAYQKGLHLVGDRENNLQLMPPLTIIREELDQGIEMLLETIKEVG